LSAGFLKSILLLRGFRNGFSENIQASAEAILACDVNFDGWLTSSFKPGEGIIQQHLPQPRSTPNTISLNSSGEEDLIDPVWSELGIPSLSLESVFPIDEPASPLGHAQAQALKV
jgi:hypothetical protein